ncbi:MAG: hypothetical protein AAFU79_17600, partial [Myxococcota bacterium]
MLGAAPFRSGLILTPLLVVFACGDDDDPSPDAGADAGFVVDAGPPDLGATPDAGPPDSGSADAALPPPPPAPPLPELIRFTTGPAAQPLLPEGAAFDRRRGAFVLGSASTGTLSVVDAAGRLSVLVPGTQFGGAGTFGVEVDEARDRILVVAASLADPTVGQLFAFAASTGALIFSVDLAALTPGLSFCNDVAIDEDGVAYVTNSDQGVIYRVDLEGTASVHFADAAFAPADPATENGFNGIVHHPSGFLLVAHSSTDRVIKITTDEAPVAMVVDVPEGALAGPDGMELVGDALVVANNTGLHFALQLRSQDEFLTASVDGDPFPTGDIFPTAIVEVGGDAYVSSAYFNVLGFGDFPTRYRLVRASFDRDARSNGAADAIAPVHTPLSPLGYGESYPAPYYAGCTDPVAPGLPDLRGDWAETTVTVGGQTIPANSAPYEERIEQCGSRILFVAQGTLSEVFDANETLFDGVNDYFANGNPNHATARLTATGIELELLLPAGVEPPPATTRELIADDDGEPVLRLFNPLLGRTVLMRRTPANAFEILTAYYGLDNTIPGFSFGCGLAGWYDGMPIVVNQRIPLPAGLDPSLFIVRRQSGRTSPVDCATLNPAAEVDERRTILLMGQFGSVMDPPVGVELVGSLLSDELVDGQGARNDNVTPLTGGAFVVLAELYTPETLPVDPADRCPAETTHIVKATWSGGVTGTNGADLDETHRLGTRFT